MVIWGCLPVWVQVVRPGRAAQVLQGLRIVERGATSLGAGNVVAGVMTGSEGARSGDGRRGPTLFHLFLPICPQALPPPL